MLVQPGAPAPGAPACQSAVSEQALAPSMSSPTLRTSHIWVMAREYSTREAGSFWQQSLYDLSSQVALFLLHPYSSWYVRGSTHVHLKNRRIREAELSEMTPAISSLQVG